MEVHNEQHSACVFPTVVSSHTVTGRFPMLSSVQGTLFTANDGGQHLRSAVNTRAVAWAGSKIWMKIGVNESAGYILGKNQRTISQPPCMYVRLVLQLFSRKAGAIFVMRSSVSLCVGGGVLCLCPTCWFGCPCAWLSHDWLHPWVAFVGIGFFSLLLKSTPLIYAAYAPGIKGLGKHILYAHTDAHVAHIHTLAHMHRYTCASCHTG